MDNVAVGAGQDYRPLPECPTLLLILDGELEAVKNQSGARILISPLAEKLGVMIDFVDSAPQVGDDVFRRLGYVGDIDRRLNILNIDSGVICRYSLPAADDDEGAAALFNDPRERIIDGKTKTAVLQLADIALHHIDKAVPFLCGFLRTVSGRSRAKALQNPVEITDQSVELLGRCDKDKSVVELKPPGDDIPNP